KRINQALGRQGKVWQDESFDCIVRSDAQLQKFGTYIRENPLKASLKPGEYRVGSGSNVGRASSPPPETGKMPALRCPAMNYFARRVGAESATLLQVGSPFDYERQMTLYVAAKMPDPRDPGYND